MKRSRVWLSVWITVLMLLTACTSRSASDPASTGTPPTTPAPNQTPKVESPTKNGVMIHADRADPATLDPAMSNGTSTYVQGLLMFDTLIAKQNDGKLVPLLAVSWTTSPDGKVYTFKLRTDVQFHSGKKMTSADVKYSLERLADKQTAAAWSSIVAEMSKVETPDDATVIVTLKAPDRLFLEKLSGTGASVQNREAIEKAGKEYGRTVVDGTGPFKLKERRINESITYERFDKYTWGPSIYKNPGPAHIQTLIWRNVPELTTRQLMIEKGEIDSIMHNSPPEVFTQAADLQNKGVAVVKRPVNETRALLINSAYPKLSDVAVRKAIAMAVDSKAIADGLYAPLGQRATNMLHFSSYGYWPGSESAAYSFDLNKAKQTLEDAGWTLGADGVRTKNGVALKDIPLMGLPQYAVTAAPIQEALGSIGIKVKVDMQERGILYPLRSTGDVPMEITNIVGTPDQLFDFFHSSKFPGTNRVGLKDKATDDNLTTFLNGTDDKAALEAAAAVQKTILVDRALLVPIYWTSELSIINTRTIKGFEPSTWMNSGLGKLLDAWSERK